MCSLSQQVDSGDQPRRLHGLSRRGVRMSASKGGDGALPTHPETVAGEGRVTRVRFKMFRFEVFF